MHPIDEMSETEETISFKEKLRSISFTYGGSKGYGTRDEFHDQPSVRQREKDHVEQLKASGIEFDRPRS